MPRTSIRFFICAILSSVLCGPQQASAQPVAAPGRAIAAAPDRPVAAPAPRGATCHDGMSFEWFLADFKQQLVAGGVSDNSSAESSPHQLVDMGILNRRGVLAE